MLGETEDSPAKPSHCSIIHLQGLPLNPSIVPYSHNYPEGSVKAFRLEHVSLLLARSAEKYHLTPFGIPEETHPECIEIFGGLGGSLTKALDKALNQFFKDSVKKWHPGKCCASLTSINLFGEVGKYSAWIEYLSRQGLEEFSWVATEISSILSLSPPSFQSSPEIFEMPRSLADETWKRDYQTFQKIYEAPTYQYALPYPIEATRPPEPPQPPQSVPEKEEIRELTAFDFLEGEIIQSPRDTILRILERISAIGEEPTTIKTTGYAHYATLADLDYHHQKSSSYSASFTKAEILQVLEHFSYIIGMSFDEAAKVVKREGMEIVLDKIEGYPQLKTPNKNPKQIKVVVRDPQPKNKGCPGPLGVVVALTGLAGLKGS